MNEFLIMVLIHRLMNDMNVVLQESLVVQAKGLLALSAVIMTVKKSL